jgi:hypothetical protein
MAGDRDDEHDHPQRMQGMPAPRRETGTLVSRQPGVPGSALGPPPEVPPRESRLTGIHARAPQACGPMPYMTGRRVLALSWRRGRPRRQGLRVVRNAGARGGAGDGKCYRRGYEDGPYDDHQYRHRAGCKPSGEMPRPRHCLAGGVSGERVEHLGQAAVAAPERGFGAPAATCSPAHQYLRANSCPGSRNSLPAGPLPGFMIRCKWPGSLPVIRNWDRRPRVRGIRD